MIGNLWKGLARPMACSGFAEVGALEGDWMLRGNHFRESSRAECWMTGRRTLKPQLDRSW